MSVVLERVLPPTANRRSEVKEFTVILKIAWSRFGDTLALFPKDLGAQPKSGDVISLMVSRDVPGNTLGPMKLPETRIFGPN